MFRLDHIITDEKLLRVPCTDATPEEVGSIIDQLERELKYSAEIGRKGIGLAAPQIGIHKNICIIRVDREHSVNLVNCKITAGYDKAIFEKEGCLSFPNRYEKTMRYQEIFIESNLVEPYSFICTGLMAVVCQHEINHWEGKLLPDFALPRLNSKRKKPRPNDLCICGSSKKYKKCCGRKS